MSAPIFLCTQRPSVEHWLSGATLECHHADTRCDPTHAANRAPPAAATADPIRRTTKGLRDQVQVGNSSVASRPG